MRAFLRPVQKSERAATASDWSDGKKEKKNIRKRKRNEKERAATESDWSDSKKKNGNISTVI